MICSTPPLLNCVLETGKTSPCTPHEVSMICSGRNNNNLEVQKTQLLVVFVRSIWEIAYLCINTTSKKKSFINMPSCSNFIIGNWCKQRAALRATMHGRPYTPGTTLDSAAKAMMSSGSGHRACLQLCLAWLLRDSKPICTTQRFYVRRFGEELFVFDGHQELCVTGAGLCICQHTVWSFVC